MEADFRQLSSLLRTELTAVHQQFFHILALRKWKDEILLKRITEVDNEDFKNALQIIDLLTSYGYPVSLESQNVQPGTNISGILCSELEMEQHFDTVLQEIHTASSEASARVERAAAPRSSYKVWLERQVAETPKKQSDFRTSSAMGQLLSWLIKLIEQPMVHAFILWHAGKLEEADNAWRTSGAGMLYATAIVRRYAISGKVPQPSTVSTSFPEQTPSKAFNRDRELAKQCADFGRAAAKDSKEESIVRLCCRITDDCELIATMEPGQEFPAIFGRSPVFESFPATRERHLT